MLEEALVRGILRAANVERSLIPTTGFAPPPPPVGKDVIGELALGVNILERSRRKYCRYEH